MVPLMLLAFGLVAPDLADTIVTVSDAEIAPDPLRATAPGGVRMWVEEDFDGSGQRAFYCLLDDRETGRSGDMVRADTCGEAYVALSNLSAANLFSSIDRYQVFEEGGNVFAVRFIQNKGVVRPTGDDE